MARAAGAPLPLLSDFTSVMPPTQVTHKCTAPGTLNLYWFPGCAPSRTISTRIYVNDVMVTTTTGATTLLTGLSTTAPVLVRLATLDRQTSSESESTATVSRLVDAADGADPRPPWILAEHGFGGVQLRWNHGGNPAVQPDSYVIVDEGTNAELKTVPGSTTSAYVPGLSTTQPTRLRLESRSLQYGVVTARNSLVVSPFARVTISSRTPPSPPRVVAAAALNGGMRLQFSIPADASTAGVIAYNVFSGTRYLRQVTSSPVEIGGLTNGVRAYIRMTSVSSAGISSGLSNYAGVTPSASAASPKSTPVARFTATGDGVILDPGGAPFVPIGANVNGSDFVWSEATVGTQSAARDNWKWTAVRVNCGMRDGGALSGGFLYFTNNNVDSIVTDYTSAEVVVMLDQHSHLGGPTGQNLPTDAGSANDPTGRSAEVAITDWWVEVARRFKDNPRVWFNLVNEPGSDRDALDQQYRRMLARIRAVAPDSVVVLDAAAFANDIPTTTSIGTGAIDGNTSFVLTNGPALAADFGPSSGYGPLVFSVHFYARWTVNWGPGGMITDEQLAARLRDYIVRCKEANLPLLIGELGVEAYAETADSACVRIALYEQGNRDGATTGVLLEQGIGFFPWHSSPLSGMPITAGGKRWPAVISREDTSVPPDTGQGLWDATH